SHVKRYQPTRDVLAAVERVLATAVLRVGGPTPLDDVVETLHAGRHYFWVGIYLVVGDHAVRQVFRGPVPPCHSFALGKGNVGTAGKTGVVKVIPDVADDKTYSMCFRETKSEIVV